MVGADPHDELPTVWQEVRQRRVGKVVVAYLALTFGGVESGISLDYLQALHAEYENFVRDISKVVPLIRVSWNEFRDVEEMAQVRISAAREELVLARAMGLPLIWSRGPRAGVGGSRCGWTGRDAEERGTVHRLRPH